MIFERHVAHYRGNDSRAEHIALGEPAREHPEDDIAVEHSPPAIRQQRAVGVSVVGDTYRERVRSHRFSYVRHVHNADAFVDIQSVGPVSNKAPLAAEPAEDFFSRFHRRAVRAVDNPRRREGGLFSPERCNPLGIFIEQMRGSMNISHGSAGGAPIVGEVIPMLSTPSTSSESFFPMNRGILFRCTPQGCEALITLRREPTSSLRRN